MYVEPGTNIRLLKNVPLNNDYKDTIYFDSSSDQATYFSQLAKYNLDDYSYQRVQRGWARVGIVADNLYDCNYMMFQNTNFGSKWFYAFITSVEYINNLVSEIHFEIDVMQTWLFDYSMQPCFIVRQHTTTDELFEHIEPENIEFGELINDSGYTTGSISYGDYFAIICTPPLDSHETHIWETNGMCTMAEYYTVANNQNSIQYFVDDVLQSQEIASIISVYLFPEGMYDGTPYDADAGTGSTVPSSNQDAPCKKTATTPTFPTDIDGYTPKNNKLFNSPYVNLEVTDFSGNSSYYKPEYFTALTTGDTANFQIVGKMIGTPEILAIPLNYRGTNYAYNEAFLCSDFPQMAISSDTYKAWLAMNGNAMVISTAANIGTTLLTMGAGSVATTAFSAAGKTAQATVGAIGVQSNALSGAAGLASSINQIMVAQAQPNRLVTKDSSGSMSVLKVKHPWFAWRVIKAEYAKMVDDYFTRYGYGIGVIATPNRKARPYWTFIQTQDCSIKGSVPADDMRLIRSIYDSGVTWWTSGSVVGNYGLDNRPSNSGSA